ncbi:MAG: sigma-54 dependent transcriptional regulator [Thermoguttaceae bacterium]|nr:sigma-54 dependent transcriptional regulator [Thermoguttaceae bacterium]
MSSTSETRDFLPDPLNILVVDDEPAHAEVVADALERIGARSVIVHSEKEALEQLAQHCFDVVVTDLMLEHDDGGITVLKAAKADSSITEVIVMTAYSGIETAVEAMRQGAFNYLQKPLDIKQLRAIVEKAGESARLRRINQELKQRLDEKFGFDGVIGHAPEMLRIIERLRRIAPTDSTVLILGETGTGKELFAQALHQNSTRKKKPFVAFNCAALTENMIESELFGHVKGAFTGATQDRIGKFEFANGGTVFLDEVGDMPLSTQAKILRVLEESEITRVGSNDVIKVNVRVISATNRNLEEEVANGHFRLDLYHRLKVITLQIPPLRDRAQDIPVLLDHFLKMFARKDHKTIKGVTPAARRILFAYDWPGNVRQLRNAAESMVALDIDELLDVDDLPDELVAAVPPGTDSLPPGGTIPYTNDPATLLFPLVGHSLAEIEQEFIRLTLSATGGNREETATMLGIGERTLYRKIKEIEESSSQPNEKDPS